MMSGRGSTNRNRRAPHHRVNTRAGAPRRYSRSRKTAREVTPSNCSSCWNSSRTDFSEVAAVTGTRARPAAYTKRSWVDRGVAVLRLMTSGASLLVTIDSGV